MPVTDQGTRASMEVGRLYKLVSQLLLAFLGEPTKIPEIPDTILF